MFWNKYYKIPRAYPWDFSFYQYVTLDSISMSL